GARVAPGGDHPRHHDARQGRLAGAERAEGRPRVAHDSGHRAVESLRTRTRNETRRRRVPREARRAERAHRYHRATAGGTAAAAVPALSRGRSGAARARARDSGTCRCAVTWSPLPFVVPSATIPQYPPFLSALM